jgi:hypothetical protein
MYANYKAAGEGESGEAGQDQLNAVGVRQEEQGDRAAFTG